MGWTDVENVQVPEPPTPSECPDRTASDAERRAVEPLSRGPKPVGSTSRARERARVETQAEAAKEQVAAGDPPSASSGGEPPTARTGTGGAHARRVQESAASSRGSGTGPGGSTSLPRQSIKQALVDSPSLIQVNSAGGDSTGDTHPGLEIVPTETSTTKSWITEAVDDAVTVENPPPNTPNTPTGAGPPPGTDTIPPTRRLRDQRPTESTGGVPDDMSEAVTDVSPRPLPGDDSATAKIARPRATATGRLIGGRYRLDRVLGRGSMGTVWAGRDEMLGRSVAVKEVSLPPGIPAQEAELIRQRTLREARSIAMLSHPNVITLFDVAIEDGNPFVVMELMPSRSLADLIHQRGALTTTQAAVIGHAVASALRAAHRTGITHRDVKPGNVLVAPDGRVKLTDFGIARNVADLPLTGTGLMLGSPAFIAPEVASGKGTSPAADAWGLGATLFAAVEARPPYDVDGDPVATVSEVVLGPVPVPERAGVLGPVIAELMTKDPARRMSIQQARDRLAPFITDAGSAIFAPVGDSVPTVRGISREQLIRVNAPSLPRRPPIADSTPLASDPGPLPFTPATPARGRKAPTAAQASGRLRLYLTIAKLAGLSIVAFLTTVLIGFAATRLIAGASLAPEVSPPAVSTVSPGQDVARQRTEVATNNGAGSGGRFSLAVPESWQMFREPGPDSPLGSSVLIHFAAPDSGRRVTVERFAGYYPRSRISAYLTQLQKINQGDEYTPETLRPLTTLPRNGPETPQELTYRTLVRTGESSSRTTYAWLVPHRNDLWIMRMTMPADQEKAGRAQFNDVADSLALLD